MPRLFLLLTALLLALPAAGRAQDAVAVRKAAERALASRFPESAERMEVRVRRTAGEAVSDGARLRLDFPQRGGAPEGLAQVQVHAQSAAGRWEKAGWALLYVAHFDSVLTARGRIGAGEAVAPGAVEVAWVETTDVRGEPLRARDFRALTAEAPLLSTRILRSGRILRQRDVRAPYAADVGAAIEMNYERGRLAFRLTCKAREPGRAQDVIRVYCPGTRTTYRARLLDDTTEGHAAEWIETL